MKTLLALSFAVLAPMLCRAAVNVVEFDSTPEGKDRYLSQPYYWWGKGKFPVKPGERGRIVSLTNDRVKFVFFLFGKEETNGAWHPAIGMVAPSRANWSATDFLEFSFGDGQHMKNCAVAFETSSDNGFILKFTAPGYEAKCSMEIRENDDRLYMLFSASDETKVKLTCYPSSYAVNYRQGKELRQRYAVTNLRRIPMGTKETLPEKEHSIFLGDSYFDPALNRGEGPCGVIYDPGRMKATLSVQNYACAFLFTGKGDMPVVLFDFHNSSNKEGERIIRDLPVTLSSVSAAEDKK